MNFPYKSVQCFIVHLIIHFVLIIHFLFYIMTEILSLFHIIDFFCYATALCELNSK